MTFVLLSRTQTELTFLEEADEVEKVKHSGSEGTMAEVLACKQIRISGKTNQKVNTAKTLLLRHFRASCKNKDLLVS